MSTVTVDVKGLDQLLALPKKLQAEAPFIAARSLTRLASESKRAMDGEMRGRFDRPTRWTMMAIATEKATKQTLRARVGLQDETLGKGGYWSEVLGHHFVGGARRLKRFELAMMKSRILPAGHYAVPYRGERNDPFGNLPRGRLTQLMSYMQSWREVGYRANMSEVRRKAYRKKTKKLFFLASRSDPRTRGLKPGIWETDDKTLSDDQPTIRPVLLFQKTARYRKRIDIHKVSQSVVDRRWSAIFLDSLAGVVK